MQHIVKITKYKHRYGINIPIDIVRKTGLKKFTHVVIRGNEFGNIEMKGYRDGEETERSGQTD